MRIRVLPSSSRDPQRVQYLTTFLIDDSVAIDAGCLGAFATPTDQARVSDVFLTHSHADHVAALPLFLENVIGDGCDEPTVHGHEGTLAALQRHVFNERIWPNFVEMKVDGKHVVRLNPLAPEKTVTVRGLKITPVPVHHPVPTFGYVVEDKHATVVFSGDTGPTTRLWEVARAHKNLRAVFLELSFPNELAALGLRAGHLTPATFAAEMKKLARPGVRFLAFHIKARWRQQTIDELARLKLDGAEPAELDREYTF